MIPLGHPQPHSKLALTLTLMVHAVLLAVLFFGVQWKRNAPEVMEVELWSERPQLAESAPTQPKHEIKPEQKLEPKVEPKPVEKPDIAIAKDKKKPEPKKAPEPPPPEPKKTEAKKVPAHDVSKLMEQAKQEQQNRDSDRLAREAAQEQKASAAQRGLAKWVDKIRIKVRGNLFMPPNLRGNPKVVYKVVQVPGGDIIKVELKLASGNAQWDSAVERAIQKSSPLPSPDDDSIFQRELELTLCPNEQGCR